MRKIITIGLIFLIFLTACTIKEERHTETNYSIEVEANTITPVKKEHKIINTLKTVELEPHHIFDNRNKKYDPRKIYLKKTIPEEAISITEAYLPLETGFCFKGTHGHNKLYIDKMSDPLYSIRNKTQVNFYCSGSDTVSYGHSHKFNNEAHECRTSQKDLETLNKEKFNYEMVICSEKLKFNFFHNEEGAIFQLNDENKDYYIYEMIQ